MRRTDGSVIIGVQSTFPGGDLSRGIGQVLLQALEAEPGTPVTTVQLTDESPRLQDLLDLTGDFPIAVHAVSYTHLTLPTKA